MKPIYHTLRNVFLKKKLAVLGFCCYLRRHESHQWHLNKNQNMGRNKFAEDEIKEIAKLLRLKNAGNRAKQKLVRHDLRTIYEFNIADMKAKRARDEARDEAAREQQAIEAGEMTDWKAVAKEWDEWENSQKSSN